MGTTSTLCLPIILVGLSGCSSGSSPTQVADTQSITVEDAYTSIGRGFLALQKVMGDQKMGMVTCKVDIKFAIAAQAKVANDTNASIAGGPSYVQAKLSDDYSTSSAGNRSNTVEITWGSIYPTICEPVDSAASDQKQTTPSKKKSAGAADDGSDTAYHIHRASPAVHLIPVLYEYPRDPNIFRSSLFTRVASKPAPTPNCPPPGVLVTDINDKPVCISQGEMMIILKQQMDAIEAKMQSGGLDQTITQPPKQSP